MSGANPFFEIPARSFNTLMSDISISDIFLIILNFGAVRFPFSISFKYDAAIPIFLANSLCPISCLILISRI